MRSDRGDGLAQPITSSSAKICFRFSAGPRNHSGCASRSRESATVLSASPRRADLRVRGITQPVHDHRRDRDLRPFATEPPPIISSCMGVTPPVPRPPAVSAARGSFVVDWSPNFSSSTGKTQGFRAKLAPKRSWVLSPSSSLSRCLMRRDQDRTQVPPSAFNTSSSCSAGLTLRRTSATFPAESMMNVVRSFPRYSRP